MICQLALIYHDVIYETGGALNEENSAIYFKEKFEDYLEKDTLLTI